MSRLSEYFTFTEDPIVYFKHTDLKHLRKLLSDPYADQALDVDIRNIWDDRNKLNIPSSILGALGFHLFSRSADRFSETLDKDRRTTAQSDASALLNDPIVKHFIIQEYSISNRVAAGDFSLHRVGTTSYIIRLDYSYDVLALK